MPTLVQKSDGNYFIRHYYNQHSTWQVLGTGVHFLKRRGVAIGQQFSTTLFMQMWTRGLIYHGDVALVEQAEAPCPAPELRERVRRLHAALRSGNAELARRLTVSDYVHSVLANRFGQEARFTRWYLEDLDVIRLDSSSQASFAAIALAVVHVNLKCTDGTDHREVEGLKEYWLLEASDSTWRCASVRVDERMQT
jgi:hypothetical protein